jgi:hypothetical protein
MAAHALQVVANNLASDARAVCYQYPYHPWDLPSQEEGPAFPGANNALNKWESKAQAIQIVYGMQLLSGEIRSPPGHHATRMRRGGLIPEHRRKTPTKRLISPL